MQSVTRDGMRRDRASEPDESPGLALVQLDRSVIAFPTGPSSSSSLVLAAL